MIRTFLLCFVSFWCGVLATGYRQHWVWPTAADKMNQTAGPLAGFCLRGYPIPDPEARAANEAACANLKGALAK